MTTTDTSDVYSGGSAADAAPKVSMRRIGQLILKTWPFIRPLGKHLAALIGIGAVLSVVGSGAFLLGSDLFSNKILVGNKLQPMQAAMLFLDESYVTAGDKDESMLTGDQRKVVRNRLFTWVLVLAIFGIPIAGGLFYYNMWVWQSINQNLRVAMIERAEHLSLKFHSHARVGDAIFRVYQDSAMINSLIQDGIGNVLMSVYGILTGLAFITFFDPRIALACLLMGVPIAWLTVWFTPRLRRGALANRRANSDLTSRIQEAFTAIKIVKANRAERRILDRFNHDSHRALDAAFSLRMDMAVLSLLVKLMGGITLIVVEYTMVSWVIGERETFLGAMATAFIGFAVWNLGAFSDARTRFEGTMWGGIEFVGLWSRIQDLLMGIERAFYLLELEPEVIDPPDPLAFPSPIDTVAWQDVHFSYSEAQPILRGVDLEGKVGRITAIVGATGSGKSTLMSMLLRLYDPEQGNVRINGVDLRDLKIDDIRRSVSIALQKNVLFAASVADNIAYSTANATRESIEAAARVACADAFIREMQSGYDTELGERGGKLSAGQRQRLSIARAIVRDTPILILDEPTASLDAQTEHQVLANLREWGREKVVLMITHRLSTIRDADQIAFLEDGRIVELGEHDELMAAKEGRYRRFVEAESVGRSTVATGGIR